MLDGNTYDKNKTTIKGFFKHHKLVFNRGLMMQEQRFVWKNDDQSVEGFFTKDNDGNTESARFEWSSEQDTKLKSDIKGTIILLGGTWQVWEEPLIKVTNELEKFDDNMMKSLVLEEIKARSQDWIHSPIIEPMTREFLEKREKQFNLSDLDEDDVVSNVYDIVDRKLSKKEVWYV